MGSFKLFSRHNKPAEPQANPPGFRYEYSQPSSPNPNKDLIPRPNSFSNWFKSSSLIKPNSKMSSTPDHHKLNIKSFALPIADSFASTTQLAHPQLFHLDHQLTDHDPTLVNHQLSPILSNHNHNQDHNHNHNPNQDQVQVQAQDPLPSLADKHSQSDPLSSPPNLLKHHFQINSPSQPNLPLPDANPSTCPTPASTHHFSRLSRKPLQLLGAKLRPPRRRTTEHPTLPHKSSSLSLALPRPPDSDSLIPHPRPSLRAVSSPASPIPTHSIPTEGSFELRSFRNLRATLDPSPTPDPPPAPAPAPAPSSRPSSIASSSRPASPSPRISAAAFRAARSERASVSSAHSLLLAPPPTTHPNLRHSRFQSSPTKAVSDSGHGSAHMRSPRSAPRPQPLIHQIPARQAQAQAQAQAPSIRTLAPLNDHDILVPPRPAFYGSRPPPRSLSADMGPPTNYQSARPQSTRLPFVQHHATGSHASVRSLPVAPATPRRTSVTTTNVREQRQLDQWHSDEEDDNTPPVAREKSRDEEDDEVPLSRLRKKSASSARDCAAAETLARGRQQLQSLEPRAPPSPLRPATHVRRASGTSASSGESARHRPPAVPPLPARVSDGMMMMVPIGPAFARGNSPTASSSSGSGSGTWSIPHTPHDSTGNVCVVAGGIQKGRVMFSGAHHEAPAASSRAHLQMGRAEGPTNGIVPQPQQRLAASQGSKSIKEEAGTVPVVGPSVWPGVPLGSPASQTNSPLIRIDDLGVPAGVDPYLYAGLGEEQKLELHHRSQMMIQMMAVQAQAAVQMHAIALSSSQAPGTWLGGSGSSEVGGSSVGRGWGARSGRSEMGVGTGVSSVGASGGGGGWSGGAVGQGQVASPKKGQGKGPV